MKQRPRTSRPSRVMPLFLLGCVAMACPACRSTIDRPFEATEAGASSLARGHALLAGLLADESRLADILVLKSPRGGIANVVRRISSRAKADLKSIRSMATLPPAIEGTEDGLPLIEVDARDRIADQQAATLLLSGGRRFERALLLTQEKATGYAAALAASLAQADPNESRRQAFEEMSEAWARLGDDVRAWLEVVEEAPDSGD